ncbi:MAG: hypothetical protein ACYSTI_03080 [Planctomycetota bacterium]
MSRDTSVGRFVFSYLNEDNEDMVVCGLDDSYLFTRNFSGTRCCLSGTGGEGQGVDANERYVL